MASIKELVDELGGGRSLSLGAVLVVCCYVAASRYVETVEARITDHSARIQNLEAAKQRYDGFEAAGGRFTNRDGAILEQRVRQLEGWVAGGKHERRDPYQPNN